MDCTWDRVSWEKSEPRSLVIHCERAPLWDCIRLGNAKSIQADGTVSTGDSRDVPPGKHSLVAGESSGG